VTTRFRWARATPKLLHDARPSDKHGINTNRSIEVIPTYLLHGKALVLHGLHISLPACCLGRCSACDGCDSKHFNLGEIQLMRAVLLAIRTPAGFETTLLLAMKATSCALCSMQGRRTPRNTGVPQTLLTQKLTN
jgi:hypothetical protein